MKAPRSVFALAICFLALLAYAGPAAAHSELVSSDPVDGSVLDAPPAQVVLTFNEPLLEEVVSAAISNSSGEVVGGAKATATGNTVTIPWPAGLAPDTYAVSYRVLADDGHPVTGSIGFTFSAIGAAPAVTKPATTGPVTTAPVTTAPAGFPIAVVGLILALAATITVIILARRGRK